MEGAPVPRKTPAALTVALWRDPATPVPQRLLSALSARGITPLDTPSPFRALASICRPPRRHAEPAASALVLVHPESLPQAAAMFECAARYAPGCRCWLYGPASDPKLRAVTAEDAAAWAGGDRSQAAPPPAAPPRAEVVLRPQVIASAVRAAAQAAAARQAPSEHRAPPPGRPRLRLAGTERSSPETLDADSGEPSPLAQGPILTPEELRMLLGDNDGGDSGQR